jgi:hypothetical protein
MRPRSVPSTAPAILRPLLRDRGYSVARRSRWGVEWHKDAGWGVLTFGIRGSRWDEVTGGSFTVEFGGGVLDLVHSAFLVYLPQPVQREWQARAEVVFDRALDRSGHIHPDGELVESRSLLLGDVISGVGAGYLDAFGWPWFDEQDATEWIDFIGRHFATAEAAAMAEAWERRHEVEELPGAEETFTPMIIASREEIAEQLWRYGEDQLAVRMLDADEATWLRVMEVAMAGPQALSRSSTSMIDTCLAYGAVEVLTGAARAPARRRRRPERELAAFWAGVGPERDRRPADGVLGVPPETIVDLTTRAADDRDRF